MIELTGSSDSVYNEVYAQIDSVLTEETLENGVSYGDEEAITEWAWKHHASVVDNLAQTVLFTYDGTWDDLVDSYREDRMSDYNESRIG